MGENGWPTFGIIARRMTHKMMDHTTDMLRAVVVAALRVRDLAAGYGEDEIKMMWATANPFREQGAWKAMWERQ